MSALDVPETRRAERRWMVIGVIVVTALLVVEVGAGMVRHAVSHEPTFLQKVEKCLTERQTPFTLVVNDPVALSAPRGTLRTTVQGDAVTVALGSSEKSAERIYGDYAEVTTPDVARTRLDRHRKVVFLWDEPPSQAQRDFMYLCTLDAQE